MRTLISVLTILSFILGSVPCYAKKLQLISGNWAPYVSANPAEPGITTEIVLAAFKAVGIETALEFYPWPRCEKMIQHNMDVVTFPYVKTHERKKFAVFSVPMITEKTYLYYSKQNMHKYDFSGYKDLRKYRIGTLNGFVHYELFKRNGVPATVIKNNTTALQMLLRNRIQLFPINNLVAKREIQNNFPDQANEFSHTKTPMYEVTLHLMISKNNPEANYILSNFAEGMSIIRREGTFDQIIEKYY
ncbi:transporter substrate-binding domain-containing protein [Maridesulfovibrio sp.]|uniref:substrate-binding periplasmic protein n=1 Tax=Maridesulfovibrio sp. TaxID=2795000 RepID=UPI002A18CF5D|nr:transporter substrate-binding domain-containing protein [Maridesulfovibrio sp.]